MPLPTPIAVAFGLALLLVPTAESRGAAFRCDAVFSNHMVLQRDKPVVIQGEAEEGEEITVRLGDQTGRMRATGGRWRVEFVSRQAGRPVRLEASNGARTISFDDVMIGDIWFCGGQSNMHQLLRQLPQERVRLGKIANPRVRMLGVAPVAADRPSAQIEIEKGFEGSWRRAEAPWLGEFSAVGYFFADELQRRLDIPIGVINGSVGGTKAQCWMPWDLLSQLQPGISPAAPGAKDVERPGGYYFGMIAPLTRVSLRGFAWYQGESNARDPIGYAQLFPALIRHWRAVWGQGDLPFAFVQVSSSTQANAFDSFDQASAWLREAQAAARSEPLTGMVVSIDCGEFGDSHPQKKEPVGIRLATVARWLIGEPVMARGPAMRSFTVEGPDVLVDFAYAEDGLEVREVVMNRRKGLPPGTDPEAFRAPADRLTGFFVCGDDKVFHPANAKIVGPSHVRVTSPKVLQPRAVRYAFSNFPVANLYNRAGLPAEPFRTDRFPPPPSIAKTLAKSP